MLDPYQASLQRCTIAEGTARLQALWENTRERRTQRLRPTYGMPEQGVENLGVGVLKGHGFQPCRKSSKMMQGTAEAAPPQGCQPLISEFFRKL